MKSKKSNLIGNMKRVGTLIGMSVAVAGVVDTARAYDSAYANLAVIPYYKSDGNLVEAPNGYFYGAAPMQSATNVNSGVIFKASTDGTVSTVHVFTPAAEWNPYGGLSSYGSLAFGSCQNYGSSGYGGFYEINTSNGEYTWLFSLSSTNGSIPRSRPVTEDGVVLYCTTSEGGKWGDGGVIGISNRVQIAQASFHGTNGYGPTSGMTYRKQDHCYYGVTPTGGAHNDGVIYRYNPEIPATLTDVYDFANTTDGELPNTEMLVDQNGVLYGTTAGSSAPTQGTVFSFDPGTARFATIWAVTDEDKSVNLQDLCWAPDGELTVNATYGGANGKGFVGLLTLNGNFVKVYDYDQPSAVNYPNDLVLGGDNTFYGMYTWSDGSTVTNYLFRLTVPMPGTAKSIGFSTNGTAVTFYTHSNEAYTTVALTNMQSSALASGTFVATNDESVVLDTQFPLGPTKFYWTFPTNSAGYNQAAIRQSPRIPWPTVSSNEPGAYFQNSAWDILTNSCDCTNSPDPTQYTNAMVMPSAKSYWLASMP